MCVKRKTDFSRCLQLLISIEDVVGHLDDGLVTLKGRLNCASLMIVSRCGKGAYFGYTRA